MTCLQDHNGIAKGTKGKKVIIAKKTHYSFDLGGGKTKVYPAKTLKETGKFK